MSETFQTETSPAGAERRAHPRQQVLFSSILLEDDNGGILLNIGERGFAMQAVRSLIGDQLPSVRFQFSLSETWFETQGRIAWMSASKRTAGVEFIDLPDEAVVQIRRWISSITSPSAPTEESPLVEQIELATFSPAIFEPVSPIVVPEPEATARAVPDPNQDAIEKDPIGDLPDAAKAQDTESVPQYSRAKRIATDAGGSTRQKKSPPLYLSYDETKYHDEVSEQTTASRRLHERIALFLVTLVFLSACVFLGIRFRRTGDGPQGGEVRAAAKASESTSTNREDLSVNPSPAFDRPGFVLQVGAMAHQENADALAESLRQRKFPVVVSRNGADRFYRVLVGPYIDAGTTLKVKEELKRQGVDAIRMPWNPPAR